ncbi:MAG TPA: 50S ribosomal protein L23 [Candidatus Paceibacterota bacterium]
MAIFGNDKGAKKASKKEVRVRAAREVKDVNGKFATMLLRPWLSEKALIGTEKSVYVFEIPKNATKHDVKNAVEKTYKVVPVQVRTVNLPAKKVNLRTRRGTGTRAARRKAYVYLKQGETIQFA